MFTCWINDMPPKCRIDGEDCLERHTEAFEHDDLKNEQIRLLEILEVGQRSFNPHFRVKAYSREAAPPYAALSYAWGNGEATEIIYLNSSTKRVRLNLYWALYYLRVLGQFRYIWVDAICINQLDVKERNEQVRIMGQIYSGAESVVCWLGLPGDVVLDKQDDIKADTLDANDDWDSRPSMWDLAHRPYWSRIWIVQELMLARNASLLCGNHLVPWSRFRNGLETQANAHRAQHGVRHICALQFPYSKSESDPWGLQHLLQAFRYSACEAPRDKVFALLGLMPQPEHDALNKYFPDYTLNEESFRVLTLRHIQSFCPFPIRILGHHELLPQALGIQSKWEWKRLLDAAIPLKRSSPSTAQTIENRSNSCTPHSQFASKARLSNLSERWRRAKKVNGGVKDRKMTTS